MRLYHLKEALGQHKGAAIAAGGDCKGYKMHALHLFQTAVNRINRLTLVLSPDSLKKIEPWSWRNEKSGRKFGELEEERHQLGSCLAVGGRIPFEGSACRTHLVAFLVPLWLPVIYPVGDLPGLPVISISRIRRATYDEPRQLKSTGRPACLTTFSPWILDWNHAWK